MLEGIGGEMARSGIKSMMQKGLGEPPRRHFTLNRETKAPRRAFRQQPIQSGALALLSRRS